MQRLLGLKIPYNKPIVISLGYIYGIGRRTAGIVLKEAKLDPQIRAKTLTSEQLNILQEVIKKHYRVEGDLKRDVMMNIKRLKDIMCWRGMRHMRGLPVRGQRTKTNNRTVRGRVSNIRV
ncbi:MAG: 30S ribosomal protein S13 [Candidatus Nealsonbacteria bacterium]|nr:30S ribosomal protein S13 [Candidatus Nealsonbacteria bacterium]